MVVGKLPIRALIILLCVGTAVAEPPEAPDVKPAGDASADPIYELADLASFGATIDRREGYDSRAVSSWGQTLQRDRIVNRLVRLDRLIAAGDADISALAKEIREIALEAWCLNNAEYDFGFTVRNQEKLQRDVTRAGMAYGVSSWLDAQPVASEVTGIGSDGRIYETRYYRSEPSAETQRRDAELSGAFNTLLSETKKRQRLSDRIGVARWRLQERMATVWDTRLWPALEKRAGSSSQQRLLECSTPEKFPDKGLVPLMPYGSLMLASVGPKPLTRVAVRVKWTTDLGDEGTWYAYFPDLDPRRRVLVLPHGELGCALYGTCSEMKAAVAVACEQGQVQDRSVSLGQPGARSPQRRWSKEQIAQQRDRIRRENRAHLRGMKRLVRMCRDAYPEPPNPERVRDRLARTLGKGQKYVGWREGKEKAPILVECQRFDGTSDFVDVTINFPSGSKVVSEHCKAKIVPELERGVVLGMEHERLPTKVQEKSKSVPRKLPAWRTSRPRRTAPRPPENEKTAPPPDAARVERKLITSPRDIENNTRPLDWADVGGILMKGPSMPSGQSSPPPRVLADYVLYVDESDRVILQIARGMGTELCFVPMFPAEEKEKP